LFERVLVPLDGSRLSTKALKYAVELVKRFDSDIILLRVVTPTTPMPAGDSAGMESAAAAAMAMEAAELQDKTKANRARQYLNAKNRQITAQGVKCSTHIIVGTPARVINQVAKKEKAGLIVMTTHGRSGIKRAILGSVADQVIRESGLPVLAIRPRK
jgi:nucleotide-binding universal stress UspA family protein